MESVKNELIKGGGLWETDTKDGSPMLSGSFTHGTRIVILKNRFKEPGTKQPDWNWFISKAEPRKPRLDPILEAAARAGFGASETDNVVEFREKRK